MRVNPRSRRGARGAAVLVAVAGLVAGPATTALADDETPPTSMELLEACGEDTDYCEFHTSGAADVFYSDVTEVASAPNCTTLTQTSSKTWEKTTTSSNSITTSLRVLAGASNAFRVGVETSYGHTWTEETTDRKTTEIEVPAGYIGKIYQSRQMETVTGTYEMHFGDRFHGHYYWYLPMTVTSPLTDGSDAVTTKSVKMTDEEYADRCGTTATS